MGAKISYEMVPNDKMINMQERLVAKQTASKPFLNLPAETIRLVLRFCSPVDIKSVTETCHLFHDIGTSPIYHISSHNDAITCQSREGDDFRVPPSFIRRKWTKLDCVTYIRQEYFVRTMVENHSLAHHIRGLKWTVLDLAVTTIWDFEDEEMAERFTEERQLNVDVEVPVTTGSGEEVWRTFDSMINVTSIDMCWLE
ncbi:hypothetical protein EK21DRAFT_113094 [Setomelanomma holmii]|uniref:F-box domain-containing protein n=1 Tax=Setomelanomma holmii TaxID=210430 RepID=A0A9P4H6U3_9PLEO|nr:hypothetical protein EK21DRAFT_113094 [Setomelanomma holmii]